MKTIKRKSMLYQTGVEYGDYTMNHVQGCAHGCKYPCYAFLMKKRFGQIKDYESWLEPVIVSNTLELLDKEIPKLRDKIQSVQLCFTTDPFMEGYPEVSKMSIAAIRKLNEAGIRCTTLTKGLLPIELSGLSPENEYGITLITLMFSYSCIRKPKKPMKRCPKCAWKNYAGKYIAKHRFGFDIEERVVLRDKQSGKIYR